MGPQSLRELRSFDSLLLRGPSGSGKTVAMQQEAKRLKAAGRKTQWTDLAIYPNLRAAEIERVTSENGLTLFIDGIDVALLSQPTLLDELGRLCSELLRDWQEHFSIRIAIRSGVRAEALAERLIEARLHRNLKSQQRRTNPNLKH